jgi:hypothetical protein
MGELVVTSPMPSMPLCFWDDWDGSRYRGAYFEEFPGVWRHGDWVTVTGRGSVIVHGRSDATLNRHGIRMGSADICQAAQDLPEVGEALVVGIEEPDGGYWMPMFVTLTDGRHLDEDLATAIKAAVRDRVSPQHVPDEVLQAPGIPHTRTGKEARGPGQGNPAGLDRDRAGGRGRPARAPETPGTSGNICLCKQVITVVPGRSSRPRDHDGEERTVAFELAIMTSGEILGVPVTGACGLRPPGRGGSLVP